MDCSKLAKTATDLLEEIIPIPALSFKEKERSDFLWNRITGMLEAEKQRKDSGTADAFKSVKAVRVKDNILVYAPRKSKKLLMLCAHVDTVQPADGYTFNPYILTKSGDRLYGLGTNDDGASAVCMLVSFFHSVPSDNRCGLLLVLSTQEEKGGKDGISAVTDYLKKHKGIPMPDFALVGEPTGMKAAVAERGLLVIDATAYGTSSHAAYPSKDNAIYNAMKDIETLRRYRFRRKSDMLGPVHLTVTQIEAGTAHNVVPDKCRYVIDIRPNERYTPEEILETLSSKVSGTLKARSLDHRCSVTPEGHLLVKTAESLGIETFVSPTSSDWARLDIPAIKIGPGESIRSHKADEFITIQDIEDGIKGYLKIIKNI